MHYFDSTGFFRRPSSHDQFATQTQFGNRFKKLWSASRGLSTPPPGSPPSTSSTLSFPFTSRRAVVVHLLLDLRARWKTCPLQYMVAWLHVGNPDRSLYIQEWKKVGARLREFTPRLGAVRSGCGITQPGTRTFFIRPVCACKSKDKPVCGIFLHLLPRLHAAMFVFDRVSMSYLSVLLFSSSLFHLCDSANFVFLHSALGRPENLQILSPVARGLSARGHSVSSVRYDGLIM